MHTVLATWGILMTVTTAAALAEGPATHWLSSDNGAPSDRAPCSLIAFVRDGELWVMNPDGSGQQRLTATKERESRPVWSPSGQALAFHRPEREGVVLYVCTNGRERRLLALGNRGFWEPPVWLSDDEIMYGYEFGAPGANVWWLNVVNRISGARRRITGPGAPRQSWQAAYHPTRGLFVQRLHGHVMGVLRMGALESPAEVREFAWGGWGCPSWSPTGERLAAIMKEDQRRPDGSYAGAEWLVRLFGPDGAPIRTLSESRKRGRELNAICWSPQGDLLAVEVVRKQGHARVPCIWWMDADSGKLLREIAKNAAQPTWAAVPATRSRDTARHGGVMQ